MVGASGMFNGLMELIITPSVGLAGLVTTQYGQILIGKAVCLVVLAVIGAQMRFRLLPRIARQEPTALLTWVIFEVAVMGVAYGLGVVLSRAPLIV